MHTHALSRFRKPRWFLVLLPLLLLTGPLRAEPLPQQGRVASLNGAEIYYEVYGEGEPLVLLHYFSGSSEIWQEFIPQLARHYRLIVPDLRGHGRSTNPSNQFTHRQSALDMFALLDLLGISRFKAIGMSTGGMTLIHMATQQPDRVEQMVLIGATIYFPEQARDIMRNTTFENLPSAELKQLRRLHKRGDGQIRELIAQFHSFKDSYDDMNFTDPYLSTIRARTLVVHGDRDEYFPVAIAADMYRSIPNAYLWIIPNGNHLPVLNSASPTSSAQREAFTQTLLEFLRGQ